MLSFLLAKMLLGPTIIDLLSTNSLALKFKKRLISESMSHFMHICRF